MSHCVWFRLSAPPKSILAEPANIRIVVSSSSSVCAPVCVPPFARCAVCLCVENVAESRSQPRCLKCACAALRCRVLFCVCPRTLYLVRSCAQFPREHRRAALHSSSAPSTWATVVFAPCPRPTGVSAVGLLFSTQRRRPSAAHHNRVVARRASTAIALRTQRRHNYANYCFTMRTEVCFSNEPFYMLSRGHDVIDKPMDLESPPIKDCHSPTTPTSPPLLHHLQQQQVPHFPTVTPSTPFNMPPTVQFPSTNNSTNTTSTMTANVNTTLAVSMSEPDHEAVGPLATLNQEEMRRKTFTSAWPHNFLDTNLLAQTGFYFIGPNDTVKCFFCKVEIGRWETDDNEVTEHQRWSQNCPLLKRRVTNNQPLDAAQLERVLPPVTIDVCGPGGIDVRHNTISEGSFDVYPTRDAVPAMPTTTYPAHSSVGQDLGPQVHSHSMMTADAQLQQPPQQQISNPSFLLAVQSAPSMRPDHPEYAIESARLRSFEDWPKTMKQKPQDLSDAGFFYTMKGDRVKCFSCGGGLRDWDENDVPWEQHAQWFRHCQYLQLIKGPEYIEEVLRLAGQTATGAAEAQSVAVAASTTAAAASSELTAEPASATAAALGSDDVNGPGGRKICDSKLCKICYSCEYNTAFLPCGHVVACAKCASSVSKCPMCRKPFERVMRVYFS